MSLDSVSDWSTTAASNVDVGGIGIQGSSSIVNGDNAMRAIMAQIASYTRRGTDLASAATLDLDSIDNLFLNITGTTTVTAVTLTSTHWRIARATGAFQMTASASLIVNGSTSANYTTTAGDLLLFEGYGSSVVRVWSIGSGGGGFQPLDAGLTALAAFNTNGILVQTANNTFAGRTLTGTANEITLTNGDGVSGNPTASLPTALTFTGKTVTAGTFSGPTISGSPTASGATWTSLGTVTTADINGGTADGVTIGGSSAAAGTFTTLTATGAFTSLGIDDNATAERFQLADTIATFGTSGAVYGVVHAVNDQALRLSGGTSDSAGGSLWLLGGAGSDGPDIEMRASGNRTYLWDNSASQHVWFNPAGTAALRLSSSALFPATNDGVAIGTTTNGVADLHGATGFTWNIANGNWVFTHSSGIGTVSTGDFRVTTAGTDSASVVTVGGTQTLTAKTLTSPVLTTPQINDTSADHQYVFAVSELSADRTVTLPLLTGADTFVFEAHTQTLTNKTLTTPTLTLKQSAGPTPTAEGAVEWDTDDNAIVVGNGSSQTIFRPDAWELIEKGTATSVATKDFTGLSAFRMLRLTVKALPATDLVVPWLRTSTDNGSTFAATANDYHVQNVLVSDATTTSSAVVTAAQFNLLANNSVGNSSTEGVSTVVNIMDWNQARYAHIMSETFFYDGTGAVNRSLNAGARAQATARDALRFMFSSGNISEMHYVLEGLRG